MSRSHAFVVSWICTVVGTTVLVLACGCGAEPSIGAASSALTAAQCAYFQVDGNVQICHRTSSSTNPYVIVRVSLPGCINGHAGHGGDYVTSTDPRSPIHDPTCGGGGCLPIGAPCDPTLPCCDGSACAGGTCQGTPPDPCAGVVCVAVDPCHVAGACDPTTGACSNPPAAEGTPCDDSDACTTNEVCSAGACVGGTPGCGGACGDGVVDAGEICDDGNQDAGDGCGSDCQLEQACDPDGTYVVAGPAIAYSCCAGIVAVNVSSFVFSDEGATVATAPSNRAGMTGAATTCPSGTFDSTGTLAGTCTETYHLSGEYVGVDTWSGTYSIHFSGQDCDCLGGMFGVPCEDQAFSVTASRGGGSCQPIGASCDATLPCCGGSACAAGTCQGPPPDLCAGVTCVAMDACHVAGTCDPTTGACSNPPAPEGTPCDDDDACTTGDACSAGACIGGTDECTCGNGVVDIGETCDDGNLDAGDGCSSDCQLEQECDPDGTYQITGSPIAYSCCAGIVAVNVSSFVFSDDGASIATAPSNRVGMTGAATTCPSGAFDSTGTVVSNCTETYRLTGGHTGVDTWSGTYAIHFTGADCDCFGGLLGAPCEDQAFPVTAQR